MGREIACPKCGAGHQIVNPGITMLVCTNCHSVVYWDVGGAIQLGQESILPPSQSRLFLFASGTLDDRTYQVVGHVRYDYGRGSWDEWYLQTSDGQEVWISEDERVITEEMPLDATAAPPYGSLSVGAPVTLGGETYTVRELATATCVGGEGQLPFSLFPGDSYPYADLASPDGTKFATLEYHADGVECFAGRVVDHDRISIEGTPPPAATQDQGEGISCTNCGANLSMPAERQVTTRVCEYCGTQLDMTTTEKAILGHNDMSNRPPFLLEIGDAGTFDGVRYEVAGRMQFRDLENYESKEYLLFNPEKGYLWLAAYDGHYTLLTEAQAQPKQFGYYAKASTQVAGQHYRVYEWGTERIVYVDGAIPWKAYVGQSHQFCTLVNPPAVYELETDGNEVEFFAGRYVSVEEIWSAFDIKAPIYSPSSVGAAQPYVRSFAMKWLMIAGAVMAVLNLALWIWSNSAEPKTIIDTSMVVDLGVREAISEPFTVESGQLIRVEVDPNFSNPWSNLAVDVVKDGDTRLDSARNRAAEKGKAELLQVSSGAGTWSGRTDLNVLFKGPEQTGTYRIYAATIVGAGYKLSSVKSTGADANTDRKTIEDKIAKLTDKERTINVRVTGNVTRPGYFMFAAFFCLLFPIIGWWSRVKFERRRWAAVIDDD